MLISLAYRVPREDMAALLGSITSYPLTEDFRTAWESLPKRKDQLRPRYSALAFGLTAATGRPVRLFGERELSEEEQRTDCRMLLLSSGSAFDDRLRVAVQAWERYVRDGKGSTVLAELLPGPEPARSFADFVKFRPGQPPIMPGWVFRTAEWQVMRQLAAAPLRVDGRRPVDLSMDTEGALLAWSPDDLLVNQAGTAFSMHRVTARLTTRVGVEDPVLCFDARLSRISPQGDWAKKVWIERGKGDAPILKLPLRRRWDKQTGEWHSHLDPAIARILEACQLSALNIPAELPLIPGRSGRSWRAPDFMPGKRARTQVHAAAARAHPVRPAFTRAPPL